jgi:6-phosphofructokinase 1
MQRHSYPVFNIPVVCLPATISNNLPGFEVSVGADTAINNIMEAVDKIKQSAVATRLCFIVEVVGLYCGYIALMSGLAAGAERIYMQEDGITLKDLQDDLNNLLEEFKKDRRMALIIRNENANPSYDISFMTAFFGEESKKYFNVSPSILGHLQHGGDPSPFDRIQAVRLAHKCVEFLVNGAQKKEPPYALMDMHDGKVNLQRLKDFRSLVELSKDDVTIGDVYQRARKQWWMSLRPIAKVLAKATPSLSSTNR